MSRADLLALSPQALADLTNKGTLRRAAKEVEERKVTWQVTEADDGTVVVDFDDEVRCELLAGRPFGDWTCTCLAGAQCRHLVRAVLAYQADAVEPVEAVEPADEAPAQDEPATPAAPSPSSDLAPEEVFDPGSINDEALAAALGPTLVRQAARLVGAGPLGHVGSTHGLAVVRLHHPSPVTVRFLAGADLNYAKCSCREPDPCLHVAVAVAVARGTPFGTTGLRSTSGDQWRPDPRVLDEVEHLVGELVTVGLEPSHRSLQGPWRRLVTRAHEAELHHLAGLADDVLTEAGHYARADARFDPDYLVGLTGELLARVTSLRAPVDERVPDRLVAGSNAEATDVGRAKLIGMGTELVENGDEVVAVAQLVDARTGSPLRVRKLVSDPDHRPSARLVGGLLGGVPFHQWGGGQVLVSGGKRFGLGDFSPTNRRVTAMPRPGLDQLAAPFLVNSLDELAHHQTRLPAALDDRSAGTDLAAVSFVAVEAVGLDPASRQLRAVLVDATGSRATLALPITRRTAASAQATAALLQQWHQQAPQVLHVAGRWRWTGHGPVVTPLLLSGDDQSVQPFVAPGDDQGMAAVADAPAQQQELTSAAAVLSALDQALGQTLVAGLDRVGGDPSVWPDLTVRLRRAGSTRLADLAERVGREQSPLPVRRLLVASVFARPLV
ncbi:SWIM zinc finger family protein [Aestuariimicrobium sp. Y1814]|uniref:SWIM zinc finger family protein n=1 Tax=Aestuariimicrobium sp. Y1814 TaxID=3418742 RepID=UPI003DA7429E